MLTVPSRIAERMTEGFMVVPLDEHAVLKVTVVKRIQSKDGASFGNSGVWVVNGHQRRTHV
jgi:hypothetical protein